MLLPKALRCPLGAVLALGLALAPPARAQDPWVNPGSMGPNALPAFAAELPWSDAKNTVRLGGTFAWGAAGDRAGAPTYRAEMPFGRFATVLAEGRPVESWRVSEATREAWGLRRSHGVASGDISFGAKFQFFDGGDSWPSVALRTMTKTTTGKSYWERRFTNAPAYLIDLLVAQRLGRLGGARLVLFGTAGFFAWQQGLNGQNDAPAWAGALRAQTDAGHQLTLEVRGYSGWQRADKPVVVSLSGEAALAGPLAVYAALNGGLRDAPRLEAQLGVQVRFQSPLPAATP